jgi:N-methylhydantoinase A/oxoprolinase/acetone carboxylase beta subunit
VVVREIEHEADETASGGDESVARAATTIGAPEGAAPVIWREELTPGASLAGPALVVERWSAIWLAPGWRAETLGSGDLLLRRR